MDLLEVQVQEGILLGKQCVTFYDKTYYSFEGIPYARPPLGKLRFRNPEPAEPWTGIRDATKAGNKCAQANPYSNSPLDGSEDCLYLNVYTPSLPVEKTQKLPVIFFVHGGRLIFGYGNYYTPDYLIKHDVILVTINYRLNALGWLCLNIPECPGNAGLKDVAMALKWVNKNIGSFNGDAQNVTLCGESAGGAMVTSFLTSNVGKGMYSKVIAQSGNSLADLYLVVEDPIEKAFKIASLMGKNCGTVKEVYDFLVAAPLEDLVFACMGAEIGRPRSTMNAYLLPVVEKTFPGIEPFFTEHPRVAISENRFHKVPIIITANSHESAIFYNDNGNIYFEKDLQFFIPKYYFVQKCDPQAENLINKIREYYFREREITECKLEYLDMVSDVFFWRDIYSFAESVSRFWDQVYVLQFNYCGGMNTRVMQSLGVKGSTHGDMIQYQFYRKSKVDKATEKDWKIVEFLSEMTCNFSKTGKPYWSRQPVQWVAYSPALRRTLLVDDDVTLVDDYRLETIEFWAQLENKYAKSCAKL